MGLHSPASVVLKRAIPADSLLPIEAAAADWQRGHKALANLRLVFADLPRLADPHDAYRFGSRKPCSTRGFAHFEAGACTKFFRQPRFKEYRSVLSRSDMRHMEEGAGF